MPDRATFNRDQWKAYIKINEEFADKTVKALHLLKDSKEKNGSAPIVWVHDYHLMLAANWIRQVSRTFCASPTRDWLYHKGYLDLSN